MVYARIRKPNDNCRKFSEKNKKIELIAEEVIVDQVISGE